MTSAETSLLHLLTTPLIIAILVFLTVTWLMWMLLPFVIYYKLERIAKATERTADAVESKRGPSAAPTVTPTAKPSPAKAPLPISVPKPTILAKRWRVAKEGGEIGEMDLEQIRKAIWSETLSPRDTYYDPQRGEWLPLNALLASMTNSKT